MKKSEFSNLLFDLMGTSQMFCMSFMSSNRPNQLLNIYHVYETTVDKAHLAAVRYISVGYTSVDIPQKIHRKSTENHRKT